MAISLPPDPRAAGAAALRRFGRFYTQRLGLLDRELLASGFNLTESRVLWELAHHAPRTATELRRTLALDAGYLSRLLGRLRERGLLQAMASPDDARARHLSLSAAGRRAFARLDAASQAQAEALIDALPDTARPLLLQAMETARTLLDPQAAPGAIVLDEPGPGDIGWVVQRHGALYAQEYGWDRRFEALVARIGADFIEQFRPGLDRGWIARRDGVNLGCVFVVQAPPDEHGPGVAKLRMLLVEPAARGLGLGHRLVAECERFAQAAGYRRMTLWTNSVLLAARAIYQSRGWQLVHQEPQHNFGHDLVSETWEKAFTARA